MLQLRIFIFRYFKTSSKTKPAPHPSQINPKKTLLAWLIRVFKVCDYSDITNSYAILSSTVSALIVFLKLDNL